MANVQNETITNSLGHTENEVIEILGQFQAIAMKRGYTEQDAYERATLLYTGLAQQEYMKHSTDIFEKTKAMTRLEEITDQLQTLNEKYDK